MLFLLNSLFARLTFRSQRFSALLEGEPTELIEDGKIIPRALRWEMISLPELRAIARRQGFPDLGDVHYPILETNES